MQTNPPRRPGELIFNIVLLLASLFLFYTAYGISGLEGLSAAGTVPLVTTAIMAVCAILVVLETWRKSRATSEKLERDIFPASVIVTITAITSFAFLLEPLGFLPTSFLFLLLLIRLFSRKGFWFSAATAAFCIIVIYVVFRLIFSVLMPQGIVPEAEATAWLGALFGGKN